MKSFTAKDAKNQFGRLIDSARMEPVMVCKHGRPVAVMMAYEEYARLDIDALAAGTQTKAIGRDRYDDMRSRLAHAGLGARD